MSRLVRMLIGSAVGVAMIVVGVVIGRAIAGPDEADIQPMAERVVLAPVADELEPVALESEPVALEELADADGETLSAAEILPTPDRLIPVLEPAFVGGGDGDIDAIAEMLLERPIVSQTPSSDAADAGVGVGQVASLPAFAGAIPAFAPIPDLEADIDSIPLATLPDGGDLDTPTGSPPSDPAATDPAATDADGPVLYDAFEAPWAFSVFGELEGLGEWIRTFLVDPCAGVNPFDPVPDGCPPGTGATLVGLDLPPEPPFAFFGSGGHYLEPGVPDSVPCPADTPGPADDSQAAVTLFSRTPIQSATLRIRPYGSSVPWTDLDGTIASPQSDIDLWNARFAEREYDVDWGTVAICFLVERDPAIAYDIEAVGVDIFSRDVTSTRGLIGIVDPDLRPPTTGRVLPNGPTAQVEARTLAGGTVRFASSDIDPADVGDGSGLDCAATPGDWRFNPAPAVVTTDTRPSYPIGLYDPAFERRYTARIPMSVAGALWVCAWIYPSENPLTPIAVDSMLFTAPTAQLPRVVLQGIRRLGDETIDRVLVTAGRESGAGSRDRCSTGGYAGYDLPPGETVSIEDTLWQCDGVPLDLDADRSTVVPVIVRRNLSGEDVIEEVAIRVSPDDCWAEPCVSRPREWYEIPIPRGSRTLCGGFGGGGGCDVEDAAGIAVIRVDYPVIEGSTDRNGGVTLLDQIDRDVRSLEPTFTRPEVTFTGGDPFVRDARVTFFTDRPMRMGLTFNDLAIVNAQPCFEGDPDVNLTDGFQDEFSLDISGLCSGNSYDVTLRGIDEAGTEWQWDNALAVTAPAVSNDFDVEIDFLGGVGEETHGFFYRFNVKVEGQSTTAYWYDFTGSQGSSANCYGLTGTTARSRGYHPPIWYSPNELTVEVNYTITTTGVGDCSGRGETGYGANTFTGSFTVADLRAGTPLVLESPDSSPLDMRVTLTPGLRWRVRR